MASRPRSGTDGDNKRTTTRGQQADDSKMGADEGDGSKEGGKKRVTAREENLKDDDELQ